jgi:hypothetical protein
VKWEGRIKLWHDEVRPEKLNTCPVLITSIGMILLEATGRNLSGLYPQPGPIPRSRGALLFIC